MTGACSSLANASQAAIPLPTVTVTCVRGDGDGDSYKDYPYHYHLTLNYSDFTGQTVFWTITTDSSSGWNDTGEQTLTGSTTPTGSGSLTLGKQWGSSAGWPTNTIHVTGPAGIDIYKISAGNGC